MNKKSLLSLVLMAGLLAPMAGTFANNSDAPWRVKDHVKKLWDDKEYGKMAMYGGTTALFTFFAISLYSLLYNDPKVHFESKGKWKDLFNLKLLSKEPKKFFRNISDVYWYRWIGQYFKDNKLKLNADGDAKMSRKKLPHGFMGNLYTHIYVTKKTSGLIGDFAQIVTPIFALCFMADRLGIIGFRKKETKDPVVTELKKLNKSLKNLNPIQTK